MTEFKVMGGGPVIGSPAADQRPLPDSPLVRRVVDLLDEEVGIPLHLGGQQVAKSASISDVEFESVAVLDIASEQLAVRVCGVEQLVADIELLAQAAQGSLEIRNALVDAFGCAVETSGVDIQNRAATQTRELWVEAKLCDGLAAIAAALRAGDLDAL